MANEKAREMGLKIKKARINANVTQAELAHKLGVTAQSISQYERGVKIPKFDTLKKIATALEIKVSCFYDLEPQKEQMFPIWRDPDKDPPKVETEVLVLVDCGKGYCITTAFYEDGTVSQYESLWQWEDVDDYGIYDEEEDLYRLAKGWWEYRHFTPDDALECPIDKPVVGWMPLPPKEVKNAWRANE